MSIATKLLKLLPPERAHAIAKWGMKKKIFAPGWYPKSSSELEGSAIKLFGKSIANPLGLAAGFDKNGELVDVIEEYGFGFMEVGSVTRGGGRGNPKPRLFRLEGNMLLNRMGLNGDPAHVVAERLAAAKSANYGINIAKTHNPDIMGDLAIEDIQQCYKTMMRFGFYHVLNISCPNTREGKTFEDYAALRELLSAIRDIDHMPRKTPLLVKLSPTLEREPLDRILQVCGDFYIDGFVACNTMSHNHPKYGKGGLSGPAVYRRGLDVVEMLHQMTLKPVIACGGIASGTDMRCYRDAGAIAFQSYTAFVHGPNAGPMFAHKVLKEYLPK